MAEPEQREYPETLKPATKPQKAQTTSERRRLLGPANASAGFWTVPESVFQWFRSYQSRDFKALPGLLYTP